MTLMFSGNSSLSKAVKKSLYLSCKHETFAHNEQQLKIRWAMLKGFERKLEKK